MLKSIPLRAALMTLTDIVIFIGVFVGVFLLVSGFGWVIANYAHFSLAPHTMTNVLTLFFLGVVFGLLPLFFVAVFVKLLAKDIYRMYTNNKDICQRINKE